MDIKYDESLLTVRSSGLKINIQFFANDPDKTEKATPRRRQKAREEGQVSYSKDLALAVVFLGVIVMLRLMIPMVYKGIEQMLIFFCALPDSGDYQEYSALGHYLSANGQDLM